MDRRLTDASLPAYFEGYNVTRDTQQPDLHEKRQRMYVPDRKFIRLFLTEGSVLDIGCARGDFLAGFAGFQKTGYDIDSSALVEGRKTHPDIAFLDADAQLLSRGPYDGVIFRGTLQCQRDLGRVRQMIARAVKPGGWVFVLATPNAESPAALVQREHWGLHNKWEHLCTFSLKTVAALFREFELVYFEFPYIGTPYENHTRDLKSFVTVCRDAEAREKFPFWGSMMNIALKRTAP
jgi:SAM-dependent methyltransferase